MTYDRLSAIDECFLHLERFDTPMHLGAVLVFERDPFYDAAGRFRLDDVWALVLERLPSVPRFRKRLMSVPLGRGRPIWVDDEQFDVRRHVRHTRLPPPGSRHALLGLAERLNAQVLDRDRPLWEVWVVEGVDRDSHVGVIYKSHHALTDGISGLEFATMLLDFTPEVPRPHPASPAPDPSPPGVAPTRARLLVDTLWERATRGIERADRARRVVGAPRQAVDRARRVGRAVGSLLGPDLVARRSSLNAPIGGGRRLEALRVPLPVAREIARAFGCTVNDVVLAAVGGGVARLLAARRELRPELVLKVFCPVSVREDTDRLQFGNRIAAMLVPLPVGIDDAPTRLVAVRAVTADLKEREQAVGSAALLGLSEYAAPTMLGLAALAGHAQRLVNLIVTNVPGPDVPFYCLGARLLEAYPIVPLSQNLTLNVAVFSYCDQLHFGLVGDGASGRDLELVAGGIEDAFAELTTWSRLITYSVSD